MRSARVVSSVIRMILGCEEMGGAGTDPASALVVRQTVDQTVSQAVSQTAHANLRIMDIGRIAGGKTCTLNLFMSGRLWAVLWAHLQYVRYQTVPRLLLEQSWGEYSCSGGWKIESANCAPRPSLPEALTSWSQSFQN